MSITWRVLVVEDNEAIASQLMEAIPNFVDAPDTAEGVLFGTFREALQRLKVERFNLVILDLRDDNAYDDPGQEEAGINVFEELKRTRFVPVVFYTAHPTWVADRQTSFVRVVEKTEGTAKVRDEVRRVLDTRLPELARHLEEAQRTYIWDFVSVHWKEMEALHHKVDLVYLVARRLAQTLRGKSVRAFLDSSSLMTPNATEPPVEPSAATRVETSDSDADGGHVADVHPVELYLYPCVDQAWLAGDILRLESDGATEYWLVLTPSCDFENSNVEFVIMAKCEPLTRQVEYEKWVANAATPSKKVVKELGGVIGDNRQSGQKERFKFLPGTFFLPDLLVDFQQLRSVPFADIRRESVVASLDSPFAEAVLARFSRYFGRLGTPNLDKDVVMKRLQATIAAKPTGASS